MKHAIVAVYFGSRDLGSMDLLEQALAHAFPAHSIHRAFLCSKFSGAASVEAVLASLQDYDSITIQAMLVSRGPTWDQLLKRCAGLPAGGPLLDSPQACIHAVAEQLPQPLVLMGHGSGQTDLTDFAASMPPNIWFGTLDGSPALETLLPRISGHPVHLAPFLLTAGAHCVQDLAQWKAKLEAAGSPVQLHTAPLAHNRQIREIFVRHLQAAMTHVHTERMDDPCISV